MDWFPYCMVGVFGPVGCVCVCVCAGKCRCRCLGVGKLVCVCVCVQESCDNLARPPSIMYKT